MLKYPHENYHSAVMHIRAENPYIGVQGFNDVYLEGHRSARHAAAELANTADAEIERLREALRPFAALLPGSLDNVGGGPLVTPTIRVQMIKDARAALL